jgi:Zn-dependent peptidase ImmA (M78 family)
VTDEIHLAVRRIHDAMDFRDPPFSTSRILEEMFPTVEVVQRKLAHYGLIEVYPRALPSGKRAVIAYHDGSHHSTQRFTIAHELAHWIFDFREGEAMPRVSCGGPRGDEERRADRFAAELLAPLAVLDRHARFTLRPDPDDDDAILKRDQAVQRLASRFNVSLMCMRNRVRDLERWRKSQR